MASTSASGAAAVAAVNGASSSSFSSLSSPPRFDSIPTALTALRAGEFVVVLDSEDRENEGDLIIPAANVTTEQMAWLIRHSSGFVCISMSPERIMELELPMMFPNNEEPHKTAYTVTVDYRHGTTTGISAADRSLTARKLSQGSGATKADFSRPGHLCPLRYTEGGVRVRMGHTEASVDLAVAAGFPASALLCELVDPDSPTGDIASRDACFKFAREHGLKVITIEALKAWREEREGPLAAAEAAATKDGKGEAALDRQRGVSLSEQKVVGPATTTAGAEGATVA